MTVTVLNRGALSCGYACASWFGVRRLRRTFALGLLGFRCASGFRVRIRLDGPWQSTANTDLLIAGTDGPHPDVRRAGGVGPGRRRTSTLLTASAENAEDFYGQR